MFPVFNVSFLFLKLINTLVVQVDLQRFRPEFRAFRSIMRQNCWPQKQPFMTLRDTHARTHKYTLNFVISTTVYVMDMVPRLNLDQHR